ncbi:MAG: hypothetical protein NUW22_13825 [Acidobacteria bacterium]|nr:hypothetical protein [Acidobacteriota bacterium]
MTQSTTILSLLKALGSDNARDYLKTSLAASLDIVDALFHTTTGHTHTGAGTNAPKIPVGSLANGAATGAALGSDVTTLTGAQVLTNKTLTDPVLNGTVTGTGLASIRSFNPFIPAAAWELPATNFPQSEKYTSLTNWPAVRVLRFDAATAEACYVSVRLPANTPVAAISGKVLWFSNSATTGAVVWKITHLSRADDEALDTAGTANTATATAPGTAKQLDTASIALTVTDYAAGEHMLLKLERDAAAGGDTFAEDAYLVGVQVEFS